MTRFPQFRPVADSAVLVAFGDRIAPDIHGRVLALDRRIARDGLLGLSETVPAYASLLVVFDPLVTDHAAVVTALSAMSEPETGPPATGQMHQVDICYDLDLATDLAAVATATGLDIEAVIAAHLAADYRVYMYGFAPGYAYLAGVPQALHLPRKPTALRDVPKGRVIIAGPQCIVTTLTMPTGWWIIGASPAQILRTDPARPFLFDIGDTVRFRRISRADYDRKRP